MANVLYGDIKTLRNFTSISFYTSEQSRCDVNKVGTWRRALKSQPLDGYSDLRMKIDVPNFLASDYASECVWFYGPFYGSV